MFDNEKCLTLNLSKEPNFVITFLLKVVFATFLLVCFLSLNKSTCETR